MKKQTKTTKKTTNKKPTTSKTTAKKGSTSTKTTIKKPTTKKTVKKPSVVKKTTPKATTKTKTPAKKPTAKTTTGKVAKAEALRQQSIKDMNKLSRISTAWGNKLKTCSNSTERKKVDDTYQRKFKQAEKVEQASYKAYHDYVSKNFTVEEQKNAMAKSKNFMSKKFTDSLKGQKGGK